MEMDDYCHKRIDNESISKKSYITDKITKNNFQFHYVIGKVGFSRVWKVERKKDRRVFALKEMSKARILAKKSVNSVMNEKHILSQLHNSYII